MGKCYVRMSVANTDEFPQRWLFALEGMLTGLIGIISWFYLPPSPTQTASKFRGKKGWFNEREEKISQYLNFSYQDQVLI